MNYKILKKSGNRARAGIIETKNGLIETPAFIPVGTKATVKSLTTEQVKDYVGAQAVLANTYHLYLQPGHEIIEKAGGLAKFMNWQGPTFTDSGGFQAFSLGSGFGKNKVGKIAQKKDVVESDQIDENIDQNNNEIALAKLNDDGVEFKSVIDGSTHFFTPEKSIEIQNAIGADIIFAFDECISPQESFEKQKKAIDRTALWAERCIVEHKRISQTSANKSALFGIVQGGRYEELRKYSAKTIGAMDFAGFGIGGSFDKDDIGTAVGWVNDILPEDKPRHLLGIGDPKDLILGIENGVDTFDCVAPTRIARNGTAYCRTKNSDNGDKYTINLLNAKFINDSLPIDKDCTCYTCKNYSRSYLAHLFRAKEMLAATLVSIHNLFFVVDLVKQARQAILDDRWEEFKYYISLGL